MATRIDPTLFRKTRLFHGFTDDEIAALLLNFDDQNYEAGDEIVSVGGRDQAIYLIVSGTVQVELPAPAFDETAVMNFDAGDAFGESSFFHSAPHGVSVRCLGPVQVIRLTRAAYDTLVAQRDIAALKLGANAAEILAARLQETDRWISDLLQEQQDRRVHDRWRSFREQHTQVFHLGGFVRPAASGSEG